MKRLVITLITIYLATGCHQQTIKPSGYSVSGQITGFEDSTQIFLEDINLDKKIDSTYIINNEFSFKGKFNSNNIPEQIWLTISSNNDKDFYYTNLLFKNGDQINVSGDKKDFPFYINKQGAKIQEEMNLLEIQTRDLDNEYDKLVKKYFSMNENDRETQGDSIRKRLKEINKIISRKTKEYIINHTNTFNAVITLGYNKNMFSKDSLKLLLEKLAPHIRKSKYGQALETYANSEIVDEGDKYYDFIAQDQKENKVYFSALFEKEKYILLDFTATYCGPCVQASEELHEIHKKYADKVKIISFCVDPNKEVWVKGLKRDKVDWRSLWDGKGKFSKTYINYGIQGVPTFFLINPQGIVIEKKFGYSKNTLTEMLKENKLIKND